ncbi:MAG: cadmium-translocating P-type ATPase [Oscillospiraceae bacterium]|jgi:Cd2+/Zn2+-exporting ATPase|nr:cadmium-translocating P-type ATPase [Oscillospiraceae bacterium]
MEESKGGVTLTVVKIALSGALFLFGLFIKTPFPAPFLASYLIVGFGVIVRAVKGVVKGDVFNENFLMLIATIGAIAIGEYPEAVAVMLFYQTGELFQEIAVGRSEKSISALTDIRPDYADVRGENGEITRISPEKVKKGDIIVIKPGGRVPSDGVIISGSTSLDEKNVTGESAPRDASVGDGIVSGTVNISGMIEARVTAEYADSASVKISRLVESGRANKSETEKFITRFARVYTPAVIIAAALITVVPVLFFNAAFADWFMRSLIFLVISCPCALTLSVPLAYFAGVGGAAKEGVLVKGGACFDALSDVKMAVFDKTGTLTKGVFEVSEVVPADGVSESALLGLTARAEYYSEHPAAKAVKNAFAGDIDEKLITSCREYPGEGVFAVVDGDEIVAGNEKLMRRFGADSRGGVAETRIHAAKNGEYLGYIVISDEIKETAADAVKKLKKKGVTPIMLTGDIEEKAAFAARETGIEEYYAGLLPWDKYEKLIELKARLAPKEKLMFAGDGLNDAPVLALADAGAAMGGLGSDAAVEAADIVVMNDDPAKLVCVIDTAKTVRARAAQNIALSLGIKFAVQVLGIMGLAAMWSAVFADVGASLIAVMNACRKP